MVGNGIRCDTETGGKGLPMEPMEPTPNPSGQGPKPKDQRPANRGQLLTQNLEVPVVVLLLTAGVVVMPWSSSERNKKKGLSGQVKEKAPKWCVPCGLPIVPLLFLFHSFDKRSNQRVCTKRRHTNISWI